MQKQKQMQKQMQMQGLIQGSFASLEDDEIFGGGSRQKQKQGKGKGKGKGRGKCKRPMPMRGSLHCPSQRQKRDAPVEMTAVLVGEEDSGG